VERRPDPPPGFLDAASGEPLHPAAADVLATLLGGGDATRPDPAAWADPSRRYGSGRRSQILLDGAREAIAHLVGCRPDELVFTASGTQALHLGLLGTLLGRRRSGTRLVCSAVEHSAVLAAARYHESSGGEVASVRVDGFGRVDLDAWTAAVTSPGTALACLQTANHEVGTVQPVVEAAEACRLAGVPLVVDAAQSVGRAAPLPEAWQVLAGSAHKWGGPPGVGILAVRPGARWRSPGPADERELGRVPGFPAVAGALAAAAALEAQHAEAAAEDVRLAALVDRIRREVPDRIADCQVLGDPVARLPHVVTFSCLYVDGEAVLDELDRAGFAVSSGSSCTSSVLEPSHVLVAMGALSQGNIRVSLPRGVREEDVVRFLDVVPTVVADVRAALGATGL
jgi:cysteine desulfurase